MCSICRAKFFPILSVGISTFLVTLSLQANTHFYTQQALDTE